MRYASAIVLLFLLSAAQAQDTPQQRVNQAIDAASRICLVGDRYKFDIDASGNLTISKLLPGGTAKLTVDRTQATGSQFFENEDIRRLVDQEIRECMKSQWPAVLPFL